MIRRSAPLTSNAQQPRIDQVVTNDEKYRRMSVQITCINKSGGYHADPHNAIEYLGWTNEQSGKTGKSTRLEVYDWIKNESGKAFVRDKSGDTALIGTREHISLRARENRTGSRFQTASLKVIDLSSIAVLGNVGTASIKNKLRDAGIVGYRP